MKTQANPDEYNQRDPREIMPERMTNANGVDIRSGYLVATRA